MRSIFILLLLSSNFVVAQKIIRKTILNSEITSVRIDAQNCFKIKMQTSTSDEVRVEAIFEGEYKNSLLVTIEEKGSSIFIGVGFSPNFKNPNDKLSAHKVSSIELLISLPESQNVQVDGTSCNIIASGKYENLKITLSDGNCRLDDVSKTVTVVTQSGNIDILGSKAKINAISKFGKVQKNDIPLGRNNYTLSTTTGNVNFSRSTEQE